MKRNRADHLAGGAGYLEKVWSGYYRHSLVETKMRCFKLLGKRIMSRDFDRQVNLLQVRAALLKCFTQLGTPVRVVIP